jgi:hypothetical protein
VVVSDFQIGAASADKAPPSDGDRTKKIVSTAKEFLGDRDPRGAREILETALAAGEADAELLWLLADAQFADGYLAEGCAQLTKAVLSSGQDAAARGREIRVLSRNGLLREALLAAEKLPADLRADPSVRTETGNLYRLCGSHAMAVESYGRRSGLQRGAVAACLWCWLRSGGPSARIRRRLKAWEESNLLNWLRRGVRYANQLEHISGLEEHSVQRLRSQINSLDYKLRRRFAVAGAVARGVYRYRLAAVILVWLVLFILDAQIDFISGPGGAAAGTGISAATAITLLFVLSVAVYARDMRPRVLVRISISGVIGLFAAAAAFEAAAGEGYADNVLPISGWWSWVVLGVVAVPAILACILTANIMMAVLWSIGYHRLIRENCPAAIAALLLDVMDDLETVPPNRPLAQCVANARNLEHAARALQQDLLQPYRVSYLGSGGWLTQRTTGWAEALRHLQRQMIAPVPVTREKAVATIAHEIRCLAVGDLGALAWREPPAREPRKVVLRRNALTALRTVLVGVLPLAAVLAAQPIIHANAGVFGWARIATATWALLYLVLSLDPAIRDKIDTASQVVGLLHNTPTGK